MDNKKNTLLVIGSAGRFRRQVEHILKDYYHLVWASPENRIIDSIHDIEDIVAIVIPDIESEPNLLEVTKKIRLNFPALPVLVFPSIHMKTDERNPTGNDEKEAAARFIRSLGDAIESYQLSFSPTTLTDYAEKVYGMIGHSRQMRVVYEMIRKIARTNSKAMILGETGTGKELVARAIHFTSARKEMRFAILNCNQKSPELVESELFGHTRGAFTGAISDRPGIFEYADGGTLFLDEIGDLDLSTQAKLLRVLETGEYQKVGSEEMRQTQIRVLCATHKNLEKMVQTGAFRKDLYYRLKGVTIYIPPLRERKDDIAVLVEKTAARFANTQGVPLKYFDSEAIDVMVGFDWPGNVRQLIDTVESLIILAESDIIIAADVNRYLGLEAKTGMTSARSLTEKVRQFEKIQIVNTLRHTRYNISAAARTLRLDRTNLRRKIKLYGIEVLREKRN